MRHWPAHSSRSALLVPSVQASNYLPATPRLLLSLVLVLLFVLPSRAQDTGTAATEFHGNGVAISVVVHDSSGEPISSIAMVQLLRGTIPAGQTQTSHGRAELVVYDVGEFTVVVQSAGYATAEKGLFIDAAGSAEVDIYLRPSFTIPTTVPGRPLLAPKARKAVDQGVRALGADNLTEAQKQASQAMLLAPGHPDVLYLQGVVFLKQRDWPKAQEMLEKATQVDPSSANAFTELGMAFCDQGKYQ